MAVTMRRQSSADAQVVVKAAGPLSDRECLRLAVRSGTLRARQFLTCSGVLVT
jgi:hypothetical protein